MHELGLCHAKELAKVTGLSTFAAYQLVNGDGNPTIKTLDRVARALDLSLEQMLGGGQNA